VVGHAHAHTHTCHACTHAFAWAAGLLSCATMCMRACVCRVQVYFVHSFRVVPTPEVAPWALYLTTYGDNFVR
jgi:hypothetical protein